MATKEQLARRGLIRTPEGRIRRATTEERPKVIVKREGGGTVTVSASGRVIEKDAQGKTLRRTLTSPGKAFDFVRQIQRQQQVTVKQRQVITRKLGEPGFTIKDRTGKIISITKREAQSIRQFEKLFREQEKRKQKIEKEFKTGTITAVERKRGLAGVSQKLSKARGIQLQRIQTGAPVLERQFRGIVVLGALGVARGVLGALETVTHPGRFVKSQLRAIKQPRETARVLGQQFRIDPVGTVLEYGIYAKTLNLAGRTVKRTPVGRFVQEELFIRAQPKEIRIPIRKIIKASNVQAKINPTNLKTLKKVNFLEIKSLNKIEANALRKTMINTDSVLFGSAAGKTITGKKSKLSIPKDADIATSNIRSFNREFINNLPRNARKNYNIRGQKLRRITGQSLFDIKPLNRLIPDRSIITKRGLLPVSGYVTKLTREPKTVLPRFRKKIIGGRLEVPTQKLVRVGKIKVVGFGEQTTRKALGTLQVLIEKNVRRAKDPQALLISLEIQLKFLQRKRRTPIIRSKIKTLKDTIKLLKSKSFSRLLERKVPQLTKQFPLVKRINVKRLRKIKVREVKRRVALELKKLKKPLTKSETKTFNRLTNKINKGKRLTKKESSLLSKLRRKSGLPSKLPSRVSSKIPSKLPIKNILKAPSKVPSIIPTFIPISKLPPTRIPPSRIPPSRPPSRIPPSKPPRAPPSRLPPKIPPKAPPKTPPFEDEQNKKKLKKLTSSEIKKRKFIYIPDLYSIIFGIKASKAEKAILLKKNAVFSGVTIRKLV